MQAISESSILFEDNHLLILNKRAGLLSQGDITGDKSLVDLLKAYIKQRDNKPGNVFLGLAHRLDRPVSGAIITSKTSKSLARINKMLQNHEIQKTYHALCLNKPPNEYGKLVSYLKKDQKRNKVFSSELETTGSKKAILNYTYLGEYNTGHHLLEIQLETGRPHQIRVQLNSINCPILGDLKYFHQQALSDKSIALHSRKLKFIHPVKLEEIEIEAPYPDRKWWKK